MPDKRLGGAIKVMASKLSSGGFATSGKALRTVKAFMEAATVLAGEGQAKAAVLVVTTLLVSSSSASSTASIRSTALAAWILIGDCIFFLSTIGVEHLLGATT
eukprot:GDKK01069036.1.p1 GENE.GDKK01069036.1~~GDKK01069036.1.p1  ORF type:complete len:103 (+),score=19.26 GDKK01069036.1:37-345(+)